MLSLKNRGTGCILGIGLLACALIAPVYAQQNQSQLAQNTGQNYQKPVGTLQVTGTIEKFTISANRADVMDTLKLIFEQAEKQFVPVGNLTGTVTLRLTEQPLVTTLDAVCKQTFLRFRFDANSGIFYIERNEPAVRDAIQRLRQLDTELRNQLRLLGLSLPSEGYFGMQNGGQNSILNTQGAGTGRVGSGFGGGNAQSAVNPNVRIFNQADSVKTLGTPPAINPGLRSKSVGGEPNQEGVGLDNYTAFLRQNNLVYFAAKEKPTPVYDILQQFGLQAGVPVLIDPGVPKGSKFVLRGTLSPRPLTDALNILAPYARLEWRWLGDSVFVTTMPEFELLLQDVSVAKVNAGQERGGAKQGSRDATDKKTEPAKEKTPPKN
ncbi:MAG: hypothetical protein NT023_22690 [Armatimonadetes bacterium]|nr:hypothetical protein [Armatimonadota bacterium]